MLRISLFGPPKRRKQPERYVQVWLTWLKKYKHNYLKILTYIIKSYRINHYGGKMKLGLRKDTVELFDHDILWEKIADETIKELKNLFGNIAVDIQHIGSTAIKNIKAKPIIDIVVGIDDFNSLDKIIDKLAKNGIFYRPFLPDDRIFIIGDMENETRTHHIHVVIYNGEEWNNQINFRDYMNNNITEVKNYEKLKIELERSNKLDRENYTKGKEDYIKKIIGKAKEWKKSQTCT
jgi:GrpB-like predicted nucleotidyltransferase (UPF0157 family)